MLNTIIFSFICFFLSCIGAATIFFIKNFNEKVASFMYSFAAGVMIASSIFSLIVPSLEYCDTFNLKDYIVLPICFFIAFLVYWFIDKLNKNNKQKINVPRLCLGIALHNIPEGMCIGFAFASASVIGGTAAYMSAVMISLGIGFQNVPEGSSVSFPLNSLKYSKKTSFLISALVAFVEVPAGIIAFLIGQKYMMILPFMLALSSALMILVACSELMPEAVEKNKKISSLSFFLGLVLMMVLDLALG